jgi:hypothetical protein
MWGNYAGQYGKIHPNGAYLILSVKHFGGWDGGAYTYRSKE